MSYIMCLVGFLETVHFEFVPHCRTVDAVVYSHTFNEIMAFWKRNIQNYSLKHVYLFSMTKLQNIHSTFNQRKTPRSRRCRSVSNHNTTQILHNWLRIVQVIRSFYVRTVIHYFEWRRKQLWDIWHQAGQIVPGWNWIILLTNFKNYILHAAIFFEVWNLFLLKFVEFLY